MLSVFKYDSITADIEWRPFVDLEGTGDALRASKNSFFSFVSFFFQANWIKEPGLTALLGIGTRNPAVTFIDLMWELLDFS